MNVCSKISSRGSLEPGLKGLVGDPLMNFIPDSVILLVLTPLSPFLLLRHFSLRIAISPATAWEHSFPLFSLHDGSRTSHRDSLTNRIPFSGMSPQERCPPLRFSH